MDPLAPIAIAVGVYTLAVISPGPSFLLVARTSLARSRTRTCLDAAGNDMSKGSASSVRFRSPCDSRTSISRRAGWAKAWKTSSSEGDCATMWFKISPAPSLVNHLV